MLVDRLADIPTYIHSYNHVHIRAQPIPSKFYNRPSKRQITTRKGFLHRCFEGATSKSKNCRCTDGSRSRSWTKDALVETIPSPTWERRAKTNNTHSLYLIVLSSNEWIVPKKERSIILIIQKSGGGEGVNHPGWNTEILSPWGTGHWARTTWRQRRQRRLPPCRRRRRRWQRRQQRLRGRGEASFSKKGS